MKAFSLWGDDILNGLRKEIEGGEGCGRRDRLRNLWFRVAAQTQAGAAPGEELPHTSSWNTMLEQVPFISSSSLSEA